MPESLKSRLRRLELRALIDAGEPSREDLIWLGRLFGTAMLAELQGEPFEISPEDEARGLELLDRYERVERRKRLL
jgi:hypothetical protein